MAGGWRLCYADRMSRAETIATINAQLASLDDERLKAIAEIVQSMNPEHGTLRPLSPRELAMVGQSKEDFRAGRTCSHEELVKLLDERLAKRGVPKSSV